MKLPVCSGNGALKAAWRLGWEFKRQKGSHVIVTKGDKLLVIPMHATLKKGTLQQILRVLGVTREEFKELL